MSHSPRPTLPPAELDRLLAELEEYDDHDVRDVAIIAAKTGLRICEILALRWKDVDFGALTLRRRSLSAARADAKLG